MQKSMKLLRGNPCTQDLQHTSFQYSDVSTTGDEDDTVLTTVPAI